MATYMLLDDENVIVNIVEWDGVTPYTPAGTLILADGTVPSFDIGDTYDPSSKTVVPAPQTADELLRESFSALERQLRAAYPTLRQWADDAAATTVTSGNSVAVLQTVVNRLGVFFDRFADLLQSQGRQS